jgi:hypothetical protein
MSGRGRKPQSLVAVLPGGRPRAPRELNPEESLIWTETVASLPADWFRADTQVLLKELVRHIHHANCLSADIDALRQELREVKAGSLADEARTKALDRTTAALHTVLRLHVLQSERIAILATKLRMSNQSRYAANKVLDRARSAPIGRPWEGWELPDDDKTRQ